MRVVCDTNIFISSILFGGSPYELLAEASIGNFKVVVSDFILTEVEKVLRKKFKYREEDIKKEIAYIKKLSIIVKPQVRVTVIKTDLSDNHILECALEGKADYIITGDTKHLLPLKRFRGIKIYSTQQFLKKVLYN